MVLDCQGGASYFVWIVLRSFYYFSRVCIPLPGDHGNTPVLRTQVKTNNKKPKIRALHDPTHDNIFLFTVLH
jgi:hypothetical protein